MSGNQEVNDAGSPPSSSTGDDLEDLNCLDFPGDVDWSSTLVLRCEPTGGPYHLAEVMQALHELVRRNEVYNLGPTFLNHVFTLSFRTSYALEGFLRFMLKNRKAPQTLKIKGHPCTITRVPSKSVTVRVRNIPLEVDSSHLVGVFKNFGTVVKTELVKSNFRGWFHVYTNERKIDLYLKKGVDAQNLPFCVEVKGMIGSVLVEEREPKCLECYHSGHKSDVCEYEKCLLYAPPQAGEK